MISENKNKRVNTQELQANQHVQLVEEMNSIASDLEKIMVAAKNCSSHHTTHALIEVENTRSEISDPNESKAQPKLSFTSPTSGDAEGDLEPNMPFVTSIQRKPTAPKKSRVVELLKPMSEFEDVESTLSPKEFLGVFQKSHR